MELFQVIKREFASGNKTAAYLGIGVASFSPCGGSAPPLLVCLPRQAPGETCSIQRACRVCVKMLCLVAEHISQPFLEDKAEMAAMQGMSTFTAGCYLESTCESILVIKLFSHMVGVF